jgi:hypothetical protein
VLSAFGKMGGSNVVHIETPEINHIKNGDFEASSDGLLPDNWSFIVHHDGGDNINDRIVWDDEEYHNGSHSLRFTADSLSESFYFIRQKIPVEELQIGQQYKISLWMKSKYGKLDLYLFDSKWDFRLEFSVEEGTDWTHMERVFTASADADYYEVYMELYQPYSSPSGLIESWIDDVKLTAYYE